MNGIENTERVHSVVTLVRQSGAYHLHYREFPLDFITAIVEKANLEPKIRRSVVFLFILVDTDTFFDTIRSLVSTYSREK